MAEDATCPFRLAAKTPALCRKPTKKIPSDHSEGRNGLARAPFMLGRRRLRASPRFSVGTSAPARRPLCGRSPWEPPLSRLRGGGWTSPCGRQPLRRRDSSSSALSGMSNSGSRRNQPSGELQPSPQRQAQLAAAFLPSRVLRARKDFVTGAVVLLFVIAGYQRSVAGRFWKAASHKSLRE